MITSTRDRAGRTTLAAAIARQWQGAGRRVAYLRLGADAAATTDATFMQQALNLEAANVASATAKGAARALDGVSNNADSVIIEAGLATDPETPEVARASGAGVVSVEAYEDGLNLIDLTVSYRAFGDTFRGVVLNKVPGHRLAPISAEIGPRLEKAGLKLLAALPEDRLLYALSVADIGDAVEGEALTALDKSEELVTAVMLGITGLDRNPVYFNRKAAKAAVLRVRAADLQMAALQTDTRCLILTGAGDVSQSVQNLAEIKDVPVIKVPGTTGEVLARIEDAFAGARFHQTGKMARLEELTGGLDLTA